MAARLINRKINDKAKTHRSVLDVWIDFTAPVFIDIIDYSVDESNYKAKFKKNNAKEFDQEIDFYLIKDDKEYLCEVKLMGSGNPESADVVIARSTNVFVADKLSIQNKNQLDHLGINWVEMRSENGFMRFKLVLESIGIPHKDLSGNFDENLEAIFQEIFT